MELDLRSVSSLEPGQTDALDSFISHRLFEASVWESPRTSDGIQHLRVVGSPRSERNAIDTYDHAKEIDWRVTLAGGGEVRDGALVVTSADSVPK